MEGGKSAPIATFPLSSVHGASAPGKGDLQIQFYEEVRMRIRRGRAWHVARRDRAAWRSAYVLWRGETALKRTADSRAIALSGTSFGAVENANNSGRLLGLVAVFIDAAAKENL